MATKTYHKGCGGEVVDRVCKKCGKKFGGLRYIFSSKLEVRQMPRFDPTEYRKRIRKGRDIP